MGDIASAAIRGARINVDMEELLDDVGMNEEKPKVRDAAWKRQ